MSGLACQRFKNLEYANISILSVPYFKDFIYICKWLQFLWVQEDLCKYVAEQFPFNCTSFYPST